MDCSGEISAVVKFETYLIQNKYKSKNLHISIINMILFKYTLSDSAAFG